MLDDTYFMRIALQEAEDAYVENEIPVGAVVVLDNQVIAKGHNLTETLKDVTAHAEMMALTAAANALGAKYLQECFPNQKVYGYYPRTSLNNHNGLEIDKVFDVQLPPSSWIRST